MFRSNTYGALVSIPAILINIEGWLLNETFGKFLAVIISLLAVTYWAMKIYDQYLITKKRKDESN